MISNNLSLSSQKTGNILNQNSLRNYATKPTRIALKHKFQVRIRESQANLFNFIKDSI